VEHLVIVRSEAPDQFVAEAVGLPALRAEAATEEEAIDRVRSSLADWSKTAKLVRVEVPVPGEENPWIRWAGRSADDPDFEEYLDEIKKFRAAMDARG